MEHQQPSAVELEPSEEDRRWGLLVTEVAQSCRPVGAPSRDWRLQQVVRGSASLDMPGRSSLPVVAGSFVLFHAQTDCFLRAEAGGCLVHRIDCAGRHLDQLVADGFLGAMPMVVNPGFDERMLELVAEIITTARTMPMGGPRLAAGALANLLARIEVAYRIDLGADQRRKVVHEARQLLMDPDHDGRALDQLADELGVGYSWFRKTFRDTTGSSPHQFRMQQRLARAQQLLSETSLPITQIASDLGFSSQAYFARLFRDKTGLSPSVWRRSRAL